MRRRTRLTLSRPRRSTSDEAGVVVRVPAFAVAFVAFPQLGPVVAGQRAVEVFGHHWGGCVRAGVFVGHAGAWVGVVRVCVVFMSVWDTKRGGIEPLWKHGG